MRPWSTSGRLLPGLIAQRLLTQGPAVQLPNKITSAETADNAGTPQLKQFLMVNIKTKFPRGILDQVISLTLADGCNGSVHLVRASSFKLQASSFKLQAPSLERYRPQASSPKLQASSSKPQASSSRIEEPGKSFTVRGPRASTIIKVFFGCFTWKAI